ncbi:hydrogenase expression/formation protein HypE [soil metagenome]
MFRVNESVAELGFDSASRRRSISLAHGGGGQLTDELLHQVVFPKLANNVLSDLLDSAVIPNGKTSLGMTIDSYVVQPLKFPGGDIGKLAVSGTINDLAVSGAKPLGVALSLILAEGLDLAVLDEVMDSIADTARQANVNVITGDTKVVGRGQADGMYITTAGIGIVSQPGRLHPKNVRPGDVLIINGPIADHGLAVMLAREMPQVQSVLRSDVAPLNGLIESVLESVPGIVFMRDPTRAGIAGVCCDLAARSGWQISLVEDQIPIRPETRHAAEMLGLDPLEVANEGKVILAVRLDEFEDALAALRRHPLGRDARVIGRVEEVRGGLCELYTRMGGRRIVQKPYGEQLPRIC